MLAETLSKIKTEASGKNLVVFLGANDHISREIFESLQAIGKKVFYFVERPVFNQSYMYSKVRYASSNIEVFSLAQVRALEGGTLFLFIERPSIRALAYVKNQPDSSLFIIDKNYSKHEMYRLWQELYDAHALKIFITNGINRLDWVRDPSLDCEVSLILPIYNIAKYLGQCLDGLLATSSRHFQILCINDGSTDSSEAIIQEYVARDSRVVGINKKNGGCASARQHGLERACSRYVIFIDPDDFTSHCYVDKLTEAVIVDDYEVAQCSYAEYFEDSGNTKVIFEDHLQGNRFLFDGEVPVDMPLLRNIAIWRCIYKKDFLIQHNINFNVMLRRFDDLPFHYKVFSAVKRFNVISDIMYFYRLGRVGQDVSFNDERLFIHFDIFDYLRETCKFNSEANIVFLIAQLRTHTWAMGKLKSSLRVRYMVHAIKDTFSLLVVCLFRRSLMAHKYKREAVSLLLSILKEGSYKIFLPIAKMEEDEFSKRRQLLKMTVFNRFPKVKFSFYRMLERVNKCVLGVESNAFKKITYFTVPKDNITSFMRYLPNLMRIDPIHPYSDEQKDSIEQGILWGIKPTPVHEEILNYCLDKGLPLTIAEDGFIRSIYNYNHPSTDSRLKSGISCLVDTNTCYYDGSTPSQGERILNSNSKFDSLVLERARECIEYIVSNKLTKYNFQSVGLPNKLKGVKDAVLIIEQTGGDMSLVRGGANESYFSEMVVAALRENQGRTVIVKVHPDNLNSMKSAYDGIDGSLIWIAEPVNPYSLFEVCSKVYVATSQLGFEALMAGKQVVCFGKPFYSGWGLTDDRVELGRRGWNRSLEEVFHVFYIQLARYFNPDKMSQVEIEEALTWLVSQRDRVLEVEVGV